MNFENPSESEIAAFLKTVKAVAVVGFSPRPQRASNNLSRQMQRFGLRIIPVRPGIAEGLGEKAYPDLLSVPDPVDVVDVFRAPAHVPAIVDECIARGFRAIWLQDGVINEEAAARAKAAGMTVIMDRCLMRDYTRLIAR